MRGFQLTDYRQVAGQNLDTNGATANGQYNPATVVRRNPVTEWGGWLGAGAAGFQLPGQAAAARAVQGQLSGITQQLRAVKLPAAASPQGLAIGNGWRQSLRQTISRVTGV